MAELLWQTRLALVAGCHDCPHPGPRWTGGNAWDEAEVHHAYCRHRVWVARIEEYHQGEAGQDTPAVLFAMQIPRSEGPYLNRLPDPIPHA